MNTAQLRRNTNFTFCPLGASPAAYQQQGGSEESSGVLHRQQITSLPLDTQMCQCWFHHDLEPGLEISKFPMMEPGSGTQPSGRWEAGRVQAHLLCPSGCFPSEMQKTELPAQELFNFDESAKVLADFVACLQVNAC